MTDGTPHPPLVRCHFTKDELEYIVAVINREKTLSAFVMENLRPLDSLGVRLTPLDTPNIIGKLYSYIKKGEELARK